MIEVRPSRVAIRRFAESMKNGERDARRSVLKFATRMLVLHLISAGLSEFISGGLSHMDVFRIRTC